MLKRIPHNLSLHRQTASLNNHQLSVELAYLAVEEGLEHVSGVIFVAAVLLRVLLLEVAVVAVIPASGWLLVLASSQPENGQRLLQARLFLYT